MYWPICGISCTFDCTWRANSWSTFSRSARIGSKICDSSGDDFSTVVQVRTLSRPEERVEVGGRLRRHGIGGDAVHVGQSGHNACDVRRFVPFPSVWDRREKRAVGLGQQPIERHSANRVTQRLRPWKREDAGERDEEAEREPRLRQGVGAGETVQDASELAAT